MNKHAVLKKYCGFHQDDFNNCCTYPDGIVVIKSDGEVTKCYRKNCPFWPELKKAGKK